jgi:RND family efflux transporter MFP subunit
MKRMWAMGFRPLAVLLTGLLAGCGGGGDAPRAEASEPLVVRTGVVKERVERGEHPLPGTVHPVDKAIIAAKLMAAVEEVDVTIGQQVAEGEILVTLSAGEIEAQVAQAEALLAQLERNLERERALLAQSATTAEAVRTLEDEIRQSRARLSEAQTMESYTRIRAPFDGIITAKEVRRGDLARPGVALLGIEGLGNREIHVQVPDSLLALPLGTAVRVESDGGSLAAELAEWSPAADPASRTRLAKLALPGDAPLRSGQYVRVNWPTDETRALWMPLEALSPMGQLKRVFTLADGRARLNLVKTGAVRDGEVRVLAGLNAGEQVVLAPATGLRDGQPVSVQP